VEALAVGYCLIEEVGLVKAFPVVDPSFPETLKEQSALFQFLVVLYGDRYV
jgi:hypothetical protein